MIPAVTVSATLVVLAVAGFMVHRSSLVRSRFKSRVIVTLKSGASFDGVLHAADARTWVLRGAQALAAGDQGTNVPVDGEVLILAADIEYAQRP